MSDQAAVAASQPAEVDVFNGEQPTLAEYSQYRQSGELPARFKPADTADPAPADPPQDPPEGEAPGTDPDSDPDKQQEKKSKGKTAEDRIAQLEATIRKIEEGAGIKRKAEVATVTEQPKVSPQNYQEWRKSFKPSQWIETYGKQNPEATYEDANAAMSDYLGDVRDQFKSVEQQRQSQAKELSDKVTDARGRYGEKFDEVLAPTVAKIISDVGIHPDVKEMINDSEVVADLTFVLGCDDDKALNELRSMPKNRGLRYVAKLEAGIIDELANQTTATARDDSGKFTASPAKPKTSAPKPPSPVSGASSGAFDVSDESLSPEEWARQRNTQLAKRRG